MSKILNRMRRGEQVMGTWIQSKAPNVLEALEGLFDFVVIDTEHVPTGHADILNMLRATQTPVIVRLPGPSPLLARMMLDAGADGIIAPMVETPEQAKEIWNATRYPAKCGNRGVGYCRANCYGAHMIASTSNFEGLCGIQIETECSVDNLHDILTTGRPDLVMIGPLDLAASTGISQGAVEFKKMCRHIEAAANAIGAAFGVHVVEPDQKKFHELAETGCKFIAFSTDLRILRTAVEKWLVR